MHIGRFMGRRDRLCGLLLCAALGACGGGGDGSPAGAADVTVSGSVTYARVPFRPLPAVPGPGPGLDYGAIRQEPSRGIRIEALNATSQTVLASGITDEAGRFSLTVPRSSRIVLRATAELVRAAPLALPHWQVSVRDLHPETGSVLGAIYSVVGAPFDSGSGVARDLAIPSGWNASTQHYDSERAAAPFAILDTVYRALRTVADVAPSTTFPALVVDWSADNTADDGTFYTSSNRANARIVLAGEADVDTSEYDAHVIAHEFGHYVEDQFSRSDNIGGAHGPGDILDMRVAFGEGFGYAFAAIVLADPVPRDSFGPRQGADGHFDVERDETAFREGWFSEASNQEIVWDLFDAANDEAVELGFGPLWSVLTGAERDTEALTSIFTFASALMQQEPAQRPAIESIVGAEAITAPAIDEFGSRETNGAGSVNVLPIFRDIVPGVPVEVLSTNEFGTGNKLSSHRFLRLDVAARTTLQITAAAVGAAGRDPDVLVVRRGVVVGSGRGPSDESFAVTLDPGRYILDVFDCGNAGCNDAVAPSPTTIRVTVD